MPTMNQLRALGLAVALLGCARVSAANDEAEKAAVRAAEAWLKLIDEGKVGQSWTESAQLFKNALTKEQWEQAVKGARGPLGQFVSRKLASKTYAESLPGAPDGKYVVIQFEATYTNKKKAIETITPMLDKDGKWRVSGYFIK